MMVEKVGGRDCGRLRHGSRSRSQTDPGEALRSRSYARTGHKAQW